MGLADFADRLTILFRSGYRSLLEVLLSRSTGRLRAKTIGSEISLLIIHGLMRGRIKRLDEVIGYPQETLHPKGIGSCDVASAGCREATGWLVDSFLNEGRSGSKS